MTQSVDSVLTDFVGRNLGNESGIHTVVCQGNGNIGFTACVGGFETVGMEETQVALGIQAHHDFTKGNNSFHNQFSLLYKIIQT